MTLNPRRNASRVITSIPDAQGGCRDAPSAGFRVARIVDRADRSRVSQGQSRVKHRGVIRAETLLYPGQNARASATERAG
jgi:hypothetical protein